MTLCAFAPGRVNLIGEHTDYNDGLCLPFAIAQGVTVEARATSGTTLHVAAVDFGEHDAFDPAAPGPAAGWRAHARGVAAELGRAGVPVGGGELSISSSVPHGAGLSSSAALDVALVLALAALSGQTLEPMAIARLAQRVEHEWVGARTGLLDQLASLYGQAGKAIRLDMRTLTAEPVALGSEGWTWAVLDSGERHELAESGYNQRREECARAAATLGLRSLRDAVAGDAERLPDPLGRRVLHVVEENARVDEMVEALRGGDGEAAGTLLDASHASLRDLYEVSTPRVDATAQRLRDAGAVGARIVGGGFGGSALGLLAPGTALPHGAVAVAPGAGARLL